MGDAGVFFLSCRLPTPQAVRGSGVWVVMATLSPSSAPSSSHLTTYLTTQFFSPSLPCSLFTQLSSNSAPALFPSNLPRLSLAIWVGALPIYILNLCLSSLCLFNLCIDLVYHPHCFSPLVPITAPCSWPQPCVPTSTAPGDISSMHQSLVADRCGHSTPASYPGDFSPGLGI